MSKAPITFIYGGDEARLDRVIVAEISAKLGCSRAQVEQWIEQGRVRVEGEVIRKPARKIGAGERIEVSPAEEKTTTLSPLELPLEILFEDEHLIVINKPAGLSMHPGAGNASHTLANAVVAHVGKKQLQVGEPDRPGIVHRLDKDTTGVVVVAKSTPVLAALSKQFAERTIERRYHALVFTTPRAKRDVQRSEEGLVEAPIGRHPTDRKRMAISERGRPAITKWRVLERLPYGTLLECSLQTGRTHQIRVHMESIGSPVLGDKTYGDFSNLPSALKQATVEFGRQALHAATLAFRHPISGQVLSFVAPLPEDLRILLELFRSAS
jgi:23S rRNA pseudouridine1911/1915/1917 synthase